MSDGLYRGIAKRRFLCMDFLRIYIGFGLFAKGIYFISDSTFLSGMLLDESHAMGFGPMFLAHFIPLAHLVGGALLAIGLLTRLGVVMQLPVLLGAVFLTFRSDGLFTHGQTLEFTILVLFLLVLLLIHGSGRLSSDFLIFHGESQGGPSGWLWLERKFESWKPVTVDLLRIYLGIALAVLGVSFLMKPETLSGIASRDGLGWISSVAMIVPFVHIIGGALMALGIISRLAALVQVPILAGAVLFVYLPLGLFTAEQTLEFTMLVLFLLILLSIYPAEKLSIGSAKPSVA